MFFFFKRPKIVVDCFIDNYTIHSLYKIDYTNKFIPNEWKQIPNSYEEKVNSDFKSKLKILRPTIKRCSSFVNTFSTGFVIPAWTDMNIEVIEDGTNYSVDPTGTLSIQHHPRSLYWDSLFEGYGQVKIVNPWLISESTGIRFTWNQCDWTNTDRIKNFHIVSGMIDYKGQNSTHINAFIPRRTVVEIQAGDPLVRLVPITEKDFELRTHLVDNVEYRKVYYKNNYRTKFVGQHQKNLNIVEESKCPFGFGKK